LGVGAEAAGASIHGIDDGVSGVRSTVGRALLGRVRITHSFGSDEFFEVRLSSKGPFRSGPGVSSPELGSRLP
jgi:hypothetical protein